MQKMGQLSVSSEIERAKLVYNNALFFTYRNGHGIVCDVDRYYSFFTASAVKRSDVLEQCGRPTASRPSRLWFSKRALSSSEKRSVSSTY